MLKIEGKWPVAAKVALYSDKEALYPAKEALYDAKVAVYPDKEALYGAGRDSGRRWGCKNIIDSLLFFDTFIIFALESLRKRANNICAKT